jgi:hypothetical protein
MSDGEPELDRREDGRDVVEEVEVRGGSPANELVDTEFNEERNNSNVQLPKVQKGATPTASESGEPRDDVQTTTSSTGGYALNLEPPEGCKLFIAQLDYGTQVLL